MERRSCTRCYFPRGPNPLLLYCLLGPRLRVLNPLLGGPLLSCYMANKKVHQFMLQHNHGAEYIHHMHHMHQTIVTVILPSGIFTLPREDGHLLAEINDRAS